MAFLGKITAPLKRAVMKAGRKNSADNKVISKAFEDSDYKSRPKFVDDVKSAVIQGDKPNTPKKITKKKKESTVKRTRKEEAELKRLIREQKKDMAAEKKNEVGSTGGKSAGGRQRKTISKPGTTRGKRKVADPRNQLRGGDQFSKAEIANMTYDEVQEFIDKGIGGSALVNANRMKNNVTKGQLDEVAGMVKGGELSIAKKYGGKVKRNMGGLVGGQTKLDMNKDGMITKQDFKMMPKKKKMGGGKVFRRGGGQALRGFGKATYSNKMY